VIDQLQALREYRADLALEASYHHWPMEFRDGLKRALKWFDKKFPEAK
jgi:hypothetical protein